VASRILSQEHGMDYLSADEKARLEGTLRECISNRKALSSRIEAARELGDLKENAEYHAAREDQGLNEAKIRELEDRLATAVVADGEVVPEDMVFLGATVKLKNVDSGDESLYRLVGDASGSLDDDIVEVTPQSPLGEALMKARVGEVVRVSLRRGPKRFEIIEIVR
jgi:transcription elongation factor GreA